jgi:Spy/CpxP family protein refolding chaperone
MNEIKTYKRITWGLVILNIAILLFFIFQSQLNMDHQHGFGPHQGHNGPKVLIERQLQFDETQKAQFEELIKKHIPLVTAQEEKINQIREKLYINLLNNKDASVEESSLSSAIKEMEIININHIKEIRQICNEGQKKLFDEIGGDWSKIFNPHPPKR